MDTSELIKVIITVILAIGLGFVIEKLLLRYLIKRAEKFGWRGWRIVFRSLRGMIALWLLLIAGRSVIAFLAMPKQWEIIAIKAEAVIAVISIVIVATRLGVGFLRIAAQGPDAAGARQATTILVNITRIIVAVLGIFAILRVLGIAITPVLTALGIGGLAVALAMQDTLSNLFAGIYIISSKQINVGDMVRLLGGEEGKINDITWRTTTLRTGNGNLVVIPNSKFSQSSLTNFSLPLEPGDMTLSFVMKPGVDPEIVEAKAIAAAKATLASSEQWKESKASVQFVDQTELGLRFQLIVKSVHFSDQPALRHIIMKAVLKEFDATGIQLAFRTPS